MGSLSAQIAEIIPGLLVGNVTSIPKINLILGDRVTDEAIVTIVTILSNRNLVRLATDFADKLRARQIFRQVNHVVISLKDSADADLIGVLPETKREIDSALDLSGSSDPRFCLVHCAKGESRSVSIVVAYLMASFPSRFNLSFDEALNHVKKTYPRAQPNIGFALALRRYERELKDAEFNSI